MDPIKVIERTIFDKGLKKNAVADKLGWTPQQFSDLLARRRIIRSDDVIPLCDALDISPNELYGYVAPEIKSA